MNTKTNQLIFKMVLVMSIALLTACGTTKAPEAESMDQSSRVEITSQKPLASCNKLRNSNFDMNVSVVQDNSGRISEQYVKVKFQNLASSLLQNGYYLRFFKWRVIGTTAQLDSTPLEFSSYSLSNGQSTSNAMSAVFAKSLSRTSGYYINLRDDAQSTYQVLKVVVYKNDGSIAAQSSVLIPQFLANPADYQTNSDGTPRASNLMALHPLSGQDTANWSATQFQQSFDQHCF